MKAHRRKGTQVFGLTSQQQGQAFPSSATIFHGVFHSKKTFFIRTYQREVTHLKERRREMKRESEGILGRSGKGILVLAVAGLIVFG